MSDYFQEARYVLELVYFHHHGTRYQGRGIMTWNHEEGFHLEAFLDRSQRNSSITRTGRIGIIPRSDYFSIRMRIQGYDWAIAPHVHLTTSDWVSIQAGHLSKSFGRVIFCQSISPIYANSIWAGSALYITKSSDLRFTDSVQNSVHINNQQFSQGWRTSGIWYETDEQEYLLRGYLTDRKQLQLYWQIPKSQWSKSQGWRWAFSIQDALSIWHGETISLLQREMYRGVQRITEIRKPEELDSLNFLSPLGDRELDHNSLMRLIKFFAINSNNANVCRNIFWQLVEASHQKGWQAREILVATILEAALRTAYNYPLNRSDNSNGLVQHLLARFRSEFIPTEPDRLKKEWKKVCNKVLESFERLRHRNVHPDWLLDSGGVFSQEKLEESLDDLILLSRFYGYMILGFAGFEDLAPSLPQPSTSQKVDPSTQLESSENLPLSSLWDEERLYPTIHLARDFSTTRTYHQQTMIERRFHLEQDNNISANSSDT